MPEPAAPDVVVARTARVGRIILNRPQALNALTTSMVETMTEALGKWASEGLRAVTIQSASERVFCAGGDIRKIRQNSLDQRPEESERFFSTEYALNATLASYPVPVVALIGGLCMGGGLGLSVHGPFRVASPRASFAMPETKIGFFPDVGGTHFLPRLPGAVGRYLALTGAQIGAADALAFGLATHACSDEDLRRVPALIEEWDGPLELLLREIALDLDVPDADGIDGGGAAVDASQHRAAIDWAFGARDLAEIEARLQRLVSPGGDQSDSGAASSRWARESLQAMREASPQSLEVTDRLLAWGRERSLEECFQTELRAAMDVTSTADFIEGVRAVLVDKDKSATWATTPAPGVTGAGWYGGQPLRVR